MKSNDFYFNPRTGIDYSKHTKEFKRKEKVWEGFYQEGRNFTKSDEGVWLRDHLHYNKPNSGAIPAKPEELIKIFLKCFCPPEGNVLDPFSGSGIIPIICKNNNLNCFACELDSQRHEGILRNLNEEPVIKKPKVEKIKGQLTLF